MGREVATGKSPRKFLNTSKSLEYLVDMFSCIR